VTTGRASISTVNRSLLERFSEQFPGRHSNRSSSKK
jgi:hypothetical protein